MFISTSRGPISQHNGINELVVMLVGVELEQYGHVSADAAVMVHQCLYGIADECRRMPGGGQRGHRRGLAAMFLSP